MEAVTSVKTEPKLQDVASLKTELQERATPAAEAHLRDSALPLGSGTIAVGRASSGLFYITGSAVPVHIPPGPETDSLEDYADHVQKAVKRQYKRQLMKGWKPHPWQIRHMEYMERQANAFREFYEYFQSEYNAVKFWVDNNGGPTINEEVHVCPSCEHVFKYEPVKGPENGIEAGSE